MKKVVLTGSNGFIGKRFLAHFAKKPYGCTVSALSRQLSPDLLQTAAQDADCFFHFAGRAHKGGDFEQFREANVDFAMHMAEIAEWAEVKTFIYISSVAVFGEKSKRDPFSQISLPKPRSPYGISKLRAEERLIEFFKDKKTRLLIIRPPLIYAPDAPGNIAYLRFALKNNIPVPFTGIRNKRAVLEIDDFLTLCEEIIEGRHDEKSLLLPVSYHASTFQIYNRLAKDLDLKPRSFKAPPTFFKAASKIPVIKNKMDKLISNFEILPNWSRETES